MMILRTICSLMLFTCLCCACGEKTGEITADVAPEAFFAETEFNFGKVSEQKVLEHKFKIENRGSNSFVISKVETSCGCTAAYWSEEPVPPGGGVVVAVALNAKGKAGNVLRKTVKVFGSFKNSPKILVVRAEVVK